MRAITYQTSCSDVTTTLECLTTAEIAAADAYAASRRADLAEQDTRTPRLGDDARIAAASRARLAADRATAAAALARAAALESAALDPDSDDSWCAADAADGAEENAKRAQYSAECAERRRAWLLERIQLERTQLEEHRAERAAR